MKISIELEAETLDKDTLLYMLMQFTLGDVDKLAALAVDESVELGTEGVTAFRTE